MFVTYHIIYIFFLALKWRYYIKYTRKKSAWALH